MFEQLAPQGELVTGSSTPAERAAEIVAEAQVRAAEIEQEARQAGYEAGRLEGIAAVQAELDAPRAALAAAVEAVHSARDELAAGVELRAIELAIAVAERVVGAALDVRPELVCDVVASALRRVVDRDRLVIDLNPDDVPIVQAWLDGGGEPGASAIEVRAERRVGRGGCVVRTTEGEVDARVAEQLTRAEAVLRETFAERAA